MQTLALVPVWAWISMGIFSFPIVLVRYHSQKSLLYTTELSKWGVFVWTLVKFLVSLTLAYLIVFTGGSQMTLAWCLTVYFSIGLIIEMLVVWYDKNVEKGIFPG